MKRTFLLLVFGVLVAMFLHNHPALAGIEPGNQRLGSLPAADDDPTWFERMATRFNQDRAANSLAVAVLAALIISLILSLVVALGEAPLPGGRSWYSALWLLFTLLGAPAVIDLLRTSGLTFVLALVVAIAFILAAAMAISVMASKSPQAWERLWATWGIPILTIAGVIVASYLSFVEATQSEAVCGPLGDCGTVQESKYAIIFGILPVGVLGLAGYAAILAGWLAHQFGPLRWKNLAALAVWGMCLFGVFFSAYLTFLEPFVIGATCMWCITSAVLMILLLWNATPAARLALGADGEGED